MSVLFPQMLIISMISQINMAACTFKKVAGTQVGGERLRRTGELEECMLPLQCPWKIDVFYF